MDKNNQAFIEKMEEKTGKSYDEIQQILKDSNLSKHSAIRSMYMSSLDLSYGFANTLALIVTKSDGASQSEGKSLESILDEIYSGKKAQFRPIHELVMKRIHTFGDFEIAPKKGYLSLKRKKQFTLIGPKTNTRMEIGINGKDIEGDERLIPQPKGSMCKYIVRITSIDDVDEALFDWLKEAFIQSK